MKVLVYQLKLSGGSGKAALQYCEALARRGHEVHICFGTAHSELRGNVAGLPARARDLAVSRTLLAIQRLNRVAREDSFDVVLVNGGLNLIPILLLRRLGSFDGSLIVVREVNSPDMLVRAKRKASRLYKLILKTAYREADVVIALTNGMRTELSRSFQVALAKQLVIPNWIYLGKHVTRSFGESGKEVIFVGRLEDQKNPLLLIRAIALLPEPSKVKVTLIGEGPLRADVENEIGKFGLGSIITLLGYVSDLRPYLARATVFVLTSKYEGFPNALLEAMSCGCPIVATDCPTGPSEIITSGEIGELVPNYDAQQLSEAIGRAITRNWDYQKIYDRARDFSEDSFERDLDRLSERLCKTI